MKKTIVILVFIFIFALGLFGYMNFYVPIPNDTNVFKAVISRTSGNAKSISLDQLETKELINSIGKLPMPSGRLKARFPNLITIYDKNGKKIFEFAAFSPAESDTEWQIIYKERSFDISKDFYIYLDSVCKSYNFDLSSDY